jgi:membrane protease YdiL (CAAX protease family)
VVPVERLRPREFLRRLGIALAICVGVPVALGFAISAVPELPLGMRLLQVAVLVIVVVGYVVYVRRVEHRTLAELSAKGAVRESAWGALLGAGLLTSTVALLAALGDFQIWGPGSLADAAKQLSAAVAAALMEEIVFRGIVFRLTEAAFGTTIAIAASAALFGVAHAVSPNPTLVALVAIAVEAGILLALAYVVTRRLWFAIGIHAGWNFAQGGIFGLAVSGHRSEGLLLGRTSGPDWLTGGEFGPEASVISIAICLVASGLLFSYARRRSLLVPRARG